MPYAPAASHRPAARSRPQTAALPAPMPVGVVSDATVAATKRAEADSLIIGQHSGMMAAPATATSFGSSSVLGVASSGYGGFGVGGCAFSGGYGGYGPVSSWT